MLNSPVLNVAIGLIFIFMLYSMFASIIKEMLASAFNLRASMLTKAIERMLDDGSARVNLWVDIGDFFKAKFLILAKKFGYFVPILKATTPQKLSELFYDNPGVKYLGENKLNSKPSYLEPSVFSKAMVDIMKENGAGANTLAQITSNVNATQNPLKLENQTKKYINSLIDDSNNDIDKFKALLEQWFNNTMDRATGWYKRQAQFMLFIIGLLMATCFNIDTIQMVHKLSKDKDASDRLASMATAFINSSKSDTVMKAITSGDTGTIQKKELYHVYKDINQDREDAGMVLALGWKIPVDKKKICEKIGYVWKESWDGSGRKILGFLITAIAISLGAPFWFDLLGKLVNLKGTGTKPESSPSAGGNANNTNQINPANRVG